MKSLMKHFCMFLIMSCVVFSVQARLKRKNDATDATAESKQEAPQPQKRVVSIPGSAQEVLAQIQEQQGAAQDTVLKSTLLGPEQKEQQGEQQAVIDLINRGIDFLKEHNLHEACNKFTHTNEFASGEIYLFIFDEKGICFAHGDNEDLLWSNLYDLKDAFGTYIVRTILSAAKNGGGWITYQWRNATKISYVKQVEKDKKTYVIGAGYYPHSKSSAVVNLVKSAVAHFDEALKNQGEDLAEIFSILSYPKGRFIFGDLYLFALAFDGIIWAQGERPGLIGSDAKDRPENQDIFNQLKRKVPGEGVWVEYMSKGALKKVYAEKVVDNKGVEYFIACGYYPDTNSDTVKDLVAKGYQYLKTHGLSQSVTMFTSASEGMFRNGDLSLFVFSQDGKVLAHGENAEWMGRNLIDLQDETGRFFIKELIETAKKGGGWLNHKANRAYQSIYVEPIELGTEKYVIGSSYYPVSKRETMILLARSALAYLESNTPEHTFGEFVKADGSFIRGELGVFTFDPKGLCLTFGDDFDLIWTSLLGAKDEDGKEYVKLFINTVKRGEGFVSYKINGVKKIALVDKVVQGDQTFIVGSSYFDRS